MNNLRLILFAFLLIPVSFLMAQNPDPKITYNEKTYQQYLEKDWKGLIETGNEAIEKGVDFYYLRLRMGIAYAETANFRMAIDNYKKALTFVPGDPLTKEYLYYAYQYSGMKNTAALYAASLPKDLRKKIKPENLSALANIYMETGVAFSNYDEGKITLPSATNQYFSETMLPQWQSYFYANLLFNLSKSVSWNMAYTGLSIHSNHLYKINNNDPVEEEVPIKQNNFYTAVNIHNKEGLVIIPFFHNVNTAMDFTTVDYDTTAYALTEGVEISFDETATSWKWNDPLVGIGFYKRNKLVDYGASLSYSWLGADQQQQFSALLNYLPKGNYSLYFTPSIRFLRNPEGVNSIYKIRVGWSPSLNVLTEASFVYGDLRASHENFGAIVYTLPDMTRYKADAVINFSFSSGVSLSLRYQLTRKESFVYTNSIVTQTTSGVGFGPGTSTTETAWEQKSEQHPFTQHFIILGFNWAL